MENLNTIETETIETTVVDELPEVVDTQVADNALEQLDLTPEVVDNQKGMNAGMKIAIGAGVALAGAGAYCAKQYHDFKAAHAAENQEYKEAKKAAKEAMKAAKEKKPSFVKDIKQKLDAKKAAKIAAKEAVKEEPEAKKA